MTLSAKPCALSDDAASYDDEDRIRWKGRKECKLESKGRQNIP